MDLEKYQELTGITVPASQQGKVNATIRRTKSQLESLLGFSLSPKNLYTEKGKVQYEGYLPIDDTTELLPPDDEEGVYKLFPYNDRDSFFHTDPFKNIYKVKLVLPGNDGEFVTIVDLDNIIPQYDRDGIGKFIKRYYEWFTWSWYASWRLSYSVESPTGLQIAVEADWLSCYPDDILYLWADMISYYADQNYSVMGSIRSESVDGHSWSRGNAGGGAQGDIPPEKNSSALVILKRYAGPYGAVLRNPVR